jgi:hypothetical protein
VARGRLLYTSTDCWWTVSESNTGPDAAKVEAFDRICGGPLYSVTMYAVPWHWQETWPVQLQMENASLLLIADQEPEHLAPVAGIDTVVSYSVAR